MWAMAFMMLLVSTPAAAQRALSAGDTITVSYTTGGHTYYVARNPSNNSIMAVQDHPTMECLWVLATMTGDPSNANGKENKAVVTAVNLMADSLKRTNKYFYMGTSLLTNTGTLSLASAGTAIYTVKSSQSAGQYIMAYILSKSGKNSWYLNYNYGFQSAKNVKNPQTMRIQKWKSVKVEELNPTFLPNSAVFGYAATATDTVGQWVHASCKLTKREGKYFYDVSDPNIRIVEKEITETEPDKETVDFSWAKTGEQQMEFTKPAHNPATKTWDFTIKPIGASPWSTEETIVANPDLFKDSINSIVCHATIDGKPVTAEMQCTRRTYLKHTPPALDFSVSHSSYRFPVGGGNLTLIPYLYVQNKTEWYNTDNIVEHRDITQVYDPKAGEMVDGFRVTYPDPNLTVDVQKSATWLDMLALQELGIPFTADPNQGASAPERSAVVMVHVEYTYYTNDQQKNGTTGTFIRQVILNQDGSMTGAPIAFTTKEPKIPAGQPGEGQQAVHTQKQILYYIPGTGGNYGSEVELHPTELSFYGYRRWYNFDTGRGIQNSENSADNTIWSDAPHITSNNTAYNFSPINTDNQYSCGVFAVARENSTCAGFRTLYYGMTDPAPRIRGYKDANDGKHGGVHTIACDLSTFKDYVITEENGQLKSLTEPTLSYRMLFELHPATEIADKIENSDVRGAYTDASSWINGKYLEEYEITAPTNTDVHLHTAQRFRTYRYHESELGYFYYKGGNLQRLQSGVDNKEIHFYSHKAGSNTLTQVRAVYSPNTDNLIVNSTETGTVIYTLVLGNRNTDDIRLARFTVHYVSPTECGPSSVALLTNKEMHDRYQVLNTIDWDDEKGVAKPGNQSNVKADYHLPWDEATYGYAHRNPDVTKDNKGNTVYSARRIEDDLCFFGEYVLANQLTGYSWIDPNIVNRSGKENGYMMYVDGTIEPGIVATIKTNTAICSGQQMYCSAWIANANPAGYTSGSDPIFRFQVQGRNIAHINGKDTTYTDWQDVETFFAGEIHKGSGWQQILFPVNSHRSYSETRVCIYNFATTNKGNDFLIDDISLFATPLPISAYQAASACSGSDIVIVVKVDYNNIADDIHDKDVYYQGWIRTIPQGKQDSVTIAIPNLGEYNGYYQWYNKSTKEYSNTSRYEVESRGDQHIQDMGLLHIPAKNFNPENDTYARNHIAQSVQQYVERLQAEDAADDHDRVGRAGVFYVKGSDGKYAMYLAHLLEAKDGGHYEVRFAEDSVDLSSPLCAMSVQLPIYKKTKITWNDDSNPISTPVTGVCPNVEGKIKVVVSNTHIAQEEPVQQSRAGVQETAFGRADWLIGISADTIYGHAYAATGSMKYGKPKNGKIITGGTRADSLKFWKDSADVLFEKYYGYTRQEVQTAFVYDLRRMPYLNNPNPNYNVSDYTKLDPAGFISQRNYDIVMNLCHRGLVDMNVSSRTVILNPGDSLFLWVFPIVGSAVIGGMELEVCNEPQWVDFRTTKLSGEQSEQIFNPSPIPNEQKTPVQKLMTPTVRVTASKANEVFGVPIMNLQNAYMAWDSLRVIETNDTALKAAVETYRTNYNNWAANKQGATYPNPATFSMRYYADKVAQSTNTVKYNEAGYMSDTKCDQQGNNCTWSYYQPGDTMFFRPIDQAHVDYLADRRTNYRLYSASDADWVTKQTTEGTGPQPGFQHANTGGATMKANYTYKMTTSLVTKNFQGELNSNDKTQDGCNYATTYFDVIVVPELLIWRPTVSNEWGDDANWHGIVDGVEMDWGFAPLKTSSVIIPKLENKLLYPVVTGDTLYPMSAWYEPAACDNIYMEAGAHILGVENLSYNKAYVDMPIEHAQWHAMASPMRNMYSGDFFVPQTPGAAMNAADAAQEQFPYSVDGNGKVNHLRGSYTGMYGDAANQNTTLFDAAPYLGTRSTDAQYAFWANYYNRSVKMHHHDLTDADATTYTASAAFAPSNSLNEVITAGQGVVILGYGPWEENDKHTIPLRLPKVDTEYKYFLYGEQTQYGESTPRTEEGFHKFAWKSDNANKDQMTLTLHNEAADTLFMFGNPTMAYVDLAEFMKDNDGVLTGTFGYMSNGSWIKVSKEILPYSGHRFLAPMEAILVQITGKEAKTDINVVFKAEHLTLDNMEQTPNAPARAPETPASAPRRGEVAPAAPLQLMTITAYTDDMEATAYLGKKSNALNGYRVGEDAYFISSGVEDGTEDDYSTLTTPLNIYTVSDSTALMVDLRPGISLVPLHFLTHADYRTDSVNLICNMNIDWNTPCYLIDSVAGTREQIMNGYVMKIELPENHQSRYYIEGPDPYIQDAPQNPGITTGVEAVQPVEEDLTKYPVEKLMINGNLYLRRGPALYHVTGTRIR